jgi:DNA adenine methylase
MARRSTLKPGDPFLKWAGGKRKVVPHLLERLPARLGRYHEPFLGGGALFFRLATRSPTPFEGAVLGDGNERLMRCYRAVQGDVEQVIRLLGLYQAAHSEDFFYAFRGTDIDGGTDYEVAAWLIYLNRTAFNGLYRVNSKGGFNVPFGRYKAPVVCHAEHLRACAGLLRGVELPCEDFRAVGERVRPGDVVYFDPPYVPLSETASFTGYTSGGFGPDEQGALRDLALELAERGATVLLSNHDTAEVRELYPAELFERFVVAVPRAINSKAAKRGAVDELVIVARGKRTG